MPALRPPQVLLSETHNLLHQPAAPESQHRLPASTMSSFRRRSPSSTIEKPIRSLPGIPIIDRLPLRIPNSTRITLDDSCRLSAQSPVVTPMLLYASRSQRNLTLRPRLCRTSCAPLSTQTSRPSSPFPYRIRRPQYAAKFYRVPSNSLSQKRSQVSQSGFNRQTPAVIRSLAPIASSAFAICSTSPDTTKNVTRDVRGSSSRTSVQMPSHISDRDATQSTRVFRSSTLATRSVIVHPTTELSRVPTIRTRLFGGYRLTSFEPLTVCIPRVDLAQMITFA